MTSAHVFYIPAVAIAALVLGFIWGRTAALREMEAKEKRHVDREEAREARRRKRREKAAKRDKSEDISSSTTSAAD